MPLGDGRTHLGYQDHYVVDGGRARIILTALVAPAEVQENQPALDLLWRARFRWKLRPRQVTGDTKYGTVENIAAIEREGICAYFPLSEVGQRAGRFGEHDFVYDAAADTYRCPGGQTLRFLSHCQSTQRRIYAAPTAACAACALRSQCTTSQPGPTRGAASRRGVSGPGARPTTRRSPMPRRCANDKSGSSRCLPRPRTGMACGASACGGWRRSTARRC